MTEAASPPEPEPTVAPRPRLKKLVIHRYRNVRPGTTLVFDDTWNLLVGKNGTGKTTLLRLLEGILSGDPTRLGSHACHVEYEIEFEDARVSGSIKWNCGVYYPPAIPTLQPESAGAERPLVPFDIEIAGHASGPGVPRIHWGYVAPNPRFDVIVDGNRVEADRGLGLQAYAAPFPWMAANGVRWSPATYLVLKQLQGVCRFDEALEYFSALFGWSATRTANGRGSSGITVSTGFDDETTDTVDRLLAIDLEAVQRARAASWSGAEDPVLGEFEAHAGIGDVSFEFPVQRVDVSGNEKTVDLGPCRLRVSRPDGTLFFHDDLSFGQKRLLAFLYFMSRNAPIVLADELSNGMHRAWIDLAVEKMRDRQNFVAAQNPLILDRIGFTSAEEMRRSLIFCREENGQLVWENAPEGEMDDVYRAYDVGLQRVSDILWQKGLW